MLWLILLKSFVTSLLRACAQAQHEAPIVEKNKVKNYQNENIKKVRKLHKCRYRKYSCVNIQNTKRTLTFYISNESTLWKIK